MKISRKTSVFGALLGAFALSGFAQTAQAAPAVNVVTPSGLKAAIAKNKGKVVIVNFWATWCAPCVKELPELAKLKRANAKKGAVLLLVSGDEIEDKAKVSSTLAQKGHSGSYLIKGDIGDFFGGFDKNAKGAVAFPRTYIYNRKGQQVKMLESDHTQAQWQSIINPYL